MDEEWRPVPGFVGAYEASSLGRVRSLPRMLRCRRDDGRLLKQQPDRKGYLAVFLCGNGKCSRQMVHRVIAAAFIGPSPKGFQVNHKNGLKDDNRPENLEYVTPQENTTHAIEVLGRTYRPPHVSGADHPQSIPVIGTDVATGEERRFANAQATKDAGFHPAIVHQVCNGRGRTHRGHYWRKVRSANGGAF